MYMVSLDVLVLEHDKRLVAVAQTFHILLCDFRKLLVRQFVFRVGIDGNVQHWFFGLLIGQQIRLERTHTCAYIIYAVARFNHAVGQNDLRMFPVHLFLIVRQRAIQRTSRIYFCNHRRSNSSVSSITRLPMATSSIVACSNL